MPFKPGVSGNPNGRPRRDQCVTSCLRELFIGIPPEVINKWGKRHTGAQIAAIAIFGKIKRGDVFAFREGIDRVEGKVPQAVTGEGGGPVQVKAVIQVVSDQARDLLTDVINGGGALSSGDEQKAT